MAPQPASEGSGYSKERLVKKLEKVTMPENHKSKCRQFIQIAIHGSVNLNQIVFNYSSFTAKFNFTYY